jgi:hypothetical protein
MTLFNLLFETFYNIQRFAIFFYLLKTSHQILYKQAQSHLQFTLWWKNQVPECSKFHVATFQTPFLKYFHNPNLSYFLIFLKFANFDEKKQEFTHLE